MRTRRFSRSRICSSERARAASTPDFASTSASAGTASPASSKARSIFARACSSSSFSTTLWPRRRTSLAFGDDLLRVRQQRVQHEGGRRPAAQVLARDAGQQRMLAGGTRARLARCARAPPATRRDPHTRAAAARSITSGAGRRRGDLGLAQSGARHQIRHAHAERRLRAPAARCAPRRRRRGQRVQARLHVVALAVAALAGIHHHAAADGHHGREHADDEAVAGQQQRRLAQDAGARTPRCPGASARCPRAAAPRLRSPPCPE